MIKKSTGIFTYTYIYTYIYVYTVISYMSNKRMWRKRVTLGEYVAQNT